VVTSVLPAGETTNVLATKSTHKTNKQTKNNKTTNKQKQKKKKKSNNNNNDNKKIRRLKKKSRIPDCQWRW